MSHRQRDEQAVARFVERFAAVLTDSGVPRMPSRVFVALLASDHGRLTAGELAQLLGVSAAAISGAVRYLVGLNMVIRVREPGARRDSYAVPHDVWDVTVLQRDRLLARWEASLREGVDVLGVGTPAGARMAESVDFFAFLQQEMRGVVQRWQAHRTKAGGPARARPHARR